MQNILNVFEIPIFPKTKQGKGLENIFKKVLNHKQLKILFPEQILQILSRAIAQVKAGNISQKLLNKMRQSYILCAKKKKLLKKYTTINIIN